MVASLFGCAESQSALYLNTYSLCLQIKSYADLVVEAVKYGRRRYRPITVSWQS